MRSACRWSGGGSGTTPGTTPGNGQGGGQGSSTPSGEGTQASPYNAARAIELASALADGAKTENEVYVAGKVSKITYTFDTTHGTATFYISDDGSESGAQFLIYSTKYLKNAKWVDGNTQIKVGDSVVVICKLYKYVKDGKTTPETSEAYLYSLNGKTE